MLDDRKEPMLPAGARQAPRTMPVLSFYTTAVTGMDGRIAFFEDIYGHDQRLESALTRAKPKPLRAGRGLQRADVSAPLAAHERLASTCRATGKKGSPSRTSSRHCLCSN